MGKFFKLRGRLDEIKGYRRRVYTRLVERRIFLRSCCWIGRDISYIRSDEPAIL